MVLLLLFLTSICAGEVWGGWGQGPRFVRLPEQSVIPLHYKIKLLPWMETKDWLLEGTTTIEILTADENTQNITLHFTHEMEEVKVLNNALEIPMLNVSQNVSSNQITLHLAETLKKGLVYDLFFKFKYTVTNESDDGLGIYLREEVVDGTTYYSLATHFQKVGAREAFPCFDEPVYKSQFKITLGHRENYTAVSNQGVVETVPIEGEPGWVWTTYNESEVMAAYHVALFIGILEKNTIETAAGPVSVYDNPGRSNSSQLALRAGASALDSYGLCLSDQATEFR